MILRIRISCATLAVAGLGLSWALGEAPDRPSAEPDLADVIFAVRPYGPDGHYYANFGYYCADPNQKAYPEGGRLCRLDPQNGKVTVLLDDPTGGVRDPHVHYDAGKILFSYR
ncbi:MAG: hypothetical protein HQ582_31055, partial [Planctomycetes bacterium]|nr:hypothetical protein [Planctomycetota bacterium]